MNATQLAASRVVRTTMDSATAALQHGRLRIDETQRAAEMAVDYSKTAEAEALELSRRLAGYEMQEQRVGFAEKAELELSAISKNASEQEQKAIRMVEAYADEVHQVSVSRLEADCERQHRALYDRFQAEKSTYGAQVREANAEVAAHSSSALSARTEAARLATSNAQLEANLKDCHMSITNCRAELEQHNANAAEVKRLRSAPNTPLKPHVLQSTKPEPPISWPSLATWRPTCSPMSKTWLPTSSR